MPPPPSDAETDSWFAENLRPYEDSLRAYLRSSLRSPSEVDDVLQDTYLRILRARATSEIRSAKALLFTIARNAVRDRLRHHAAFQHEPITENEGSPVLQDGTDIPEWVAHRQELALLAEAVRALPPRCREVILLRKIQNLSQKEISARLGISENTVETLAARGMIQCREFMRARIAAPAANPRP